MAICAKNRLIASLTALLASVSADADARSSTVTSSPQAPREVTAVTTAVAEPTIPFERYELSNGLQVVLSRDPRLPQVVVDVWYHVGGADEAPGKSGFAHLFEHMMFTGSKHINSPRQVLEAVGSSTDMANGTTGDDYTQYFEAVPASELPTALWLESDRMAFLLDTLNQKRLEVQRDVVSNERRQRVENRPYGTAALRTCELLYPKSHPSFGCGIGTVADVESAQLDDVRDFFRRYYSPNNAALAIVGNFKVAEAKELVEKYFGAIPRGADVVRPTVKEPELPGVVRETIEDQVATVAQLRFIWNGVKQLGPDEPAGDVLARILSVGKGSRLYQALVSRLQLASEVRAENDTSALGGPFSISATVTGGHTTSEIEPVLEEVLRDVREHGVTADEVERAQRGIIAAKVNSLERTGGFGGRADTLCFYTLATGDPGYLAKDLARYRAVTPQAVKAFANKVLPKDRKLILDVQPAPRTNKEPK